MDEKYFIVNNNELCFSLLFFQECLAKTLDSPTLKIISAIPDQKPALEKVNEAKYQQDSEKKIIGISNYKLSYEVNQKKFHAHVLVKSKKSSAVFIDFACSILGKCDFTLNKPLKHYISQLEFNKADTKELNIFLEQKNHPMLEEYMPKVYGVYEDIANDDFILIEELIEDAVMTTDYSIVQPWSDGFITATIEALAGLHSVWYHQDAELKKLTWINPVKTAKEMVAMTEFWNATTKFDECYVGDFIKQQEIDFQLELIASLSEWWGEVEAMPKTIVQGDMQLRNIAIRNTQPKKSCLFDWELAMIHLPQVDLVELLSFTLTTKTTKEELYTYIELHRKLLEKNSNRAIDKEQWLKGFRYALYDHLIRRMYGLLLLVNSFYPFQGIQRMYANLQHMLKLLS